MTSMTGNHMMNKPYIRAVINELEGLGFAGDQAKEVLLKHYRVVRRTAGFEPNAADFAREIVDIEKAINRKYDPTDPSQVYIGHLRDRLKAAKKPGVRIHFISKPTVKSVPKLRRAHSTHR
ncbi:hypothetical protein [Cohnella rhizosphaerae]|uniref:Uncharacterized protein n=1 Tax=Cohnella rhizosphaerae TaxID=1457232 RepID=A0A9X4KRU8_9BACL|nr:hypothetical protein [Cohnella rhizosphaerae]MDG0809690.1 hypothetical protein [Cohnella rhizosphaerae]